MPTLREHQQAWLEAGIDTREDYTSGGGSSGVHSRSSTGYYWNGSLLVPAVAGELRLEEELEVFSTTTQGDSGTITWETLPKGYLLEPQATNDAEYSYGLSMAFPQNASEAAVTDEYLTSDQTTSYKLIPNTSSTGNHRVIFGSKTTVPSSTDYTISVDIFPTAEIPCAKFFNFAGNSFLGVMINFSTLEFALDNNSYVKRVQVIKYGTTGWYRVGITVTTAATPNYSPLYVHVYPTFSTDAWASNGTDYVLFSNYQQEDGWAMTSPILTNGTAATRNADSLLHDYDYPLGDNGKTLGLTWTHYYPKAATNVLTTATAAAGEFEATIATDASGNLDLSVKDSGASAVAAEHTYASGDEYADRVTQLDFESDDQIGFWEDNTQVGSSAAHSIATTDILADGQFTIEGFGGRIHKLAIDDPSGQSGNYSYLQLALPDYNGATALTGSGTLTIAGLTQAIGAAILNGSGTLTIQGLTQAIGAAILNGDGALTVDGLATAFGASVFNGSGTLTAQGLAEAIGAAILTGSGTLTAQGLAEVIGAAALNGSGSLAVDGLTQAIGAAIIASDGNLTVAGIAEAIGAAALNGSGTLTITGLTEAIGAAILNGSGSLTVAGLTEALGASSFIGEGTLGATGTTVVASSVSISGDGTITVEGVSGITGAAAINGSGTIGVDGLTEALGASSFLGGGIIVGSGITIVAGSVTFEGSGTILPEGITIVTSSVAISGATTIDASGQTVALGTVTIDGSGTLIIDGTTEAIGAAAFDADGTFSINGTILFGGNVIITGSGNLGVDGLTEAIGAVALDAEGNFIIRGRLVSRPPYERIYYISDEDRTYYIAKDDRSFDIENEDRTYEIR